MNIFVTMHGLSLDGSGIWKEQEVLHGNVKAFQDSGWKVGKLPAELKPKEAPNAALNAAADKLEAVERSSGLSSGIKVISRKGK
jgi:hypothetical protein